MKTGIKPGRFKTISALVLGVIMGAGIINMIIGAQVDHLTLANKILQEQLADAQRELQKLKESSDEKKKLIITSVETYLLMDSREGLTDYDLLRVELEANKKVKEWLKPLIGQDVAELDSLLIPRIVDSREIEADGNKYILKTNLVVINQKVSVYVKAVLLKGGERE